MADRDFGNAGRGAQQHRQIGLVEIVASIDPEANRLRARGRLGALLQALGKIAVGKRFGIGSGIQLDAISAEFAGALKVGAVGVHEQTDAGAQCLKFSDQRAQAGAVLAQIKAMIRGDLAVAIGHQRHLVGTRAGDQSDQSWVAAGRGGGEWIAFNVELQAFALAAPAIGGGQPLRQRGDIAWLDMALIRARMHGQAIGTGGNHHVGGVDDAGQTATASIAQHRDFVEIDAEFGHGMIVPWLGRIGESAGNPSRMATAGLITALRRSVASGWLLVAGMIAATAWAPAAADTVAVKAAGTPLITRFGPEDFPVIPRFTSIQVDQEDRVFIGNSEGVLVYAGSRFENIALPNASWARNTSSDQQGRVYVASFDHFGRLDPSAGGDWHFTDLDQLAGNPLGAHQVGEVWDVCLRPEGAYFATASHLFLARNDGTLGAWPLAAPVHLLFPVANDLWLRIPGQGLVRFNDGRFELLPGGERFADSSIAAVLPHPQGQLIVSRTAGFYLAEATGIRPLASVLGAALSALQAYHAIVLDDGSYVVVTLTGELLRFAQDLALIDRFSLSQYPVLQIASDHHGGLWAATDGDLVYLQWPSPWTQVSESDGLFGVIETSTWWHRRRWVGTSMGLFVSTEDARGRLRFEPYLFANEEVWDFLVTPSALLIAARNGVFALTSDQPPTAPPTAIGTTTYPFALYASTQRKDTVYVLDDDGFQILRHPADHWIEAGRLAVAEVSASSMVEIDADHLLLGSNRGAPWLITLSADGRQVAARQRLGPASGLRLADTDVSRVVTLDGNLYVASKHGFHRWHDGKLAADRLQGLAQLLKRPQEAELATAADGTSYAYDSRSLFRRRPPSGIWEPVPLESPMARGLLGLDIESDGRLSVVAWGGLLTFDPALSLPQKAPLRTRLQRVWWSAEGAPAQALDRAGHPPVALDRVRSIRFDYGVNGGERGLQFHSRLRGSDIDWSPWSTELERSFNRLAPGQYTFEVVARDVAGELAEPATWAFFIPPRWYQTAWARIGLYLLLAALGGVLAWIHHRWRSRKLHRYAETLEHQVAAHTRTLAMANQRLARIAVQDGLTGLTNRRGLDEFLQTQWAASLQLQQPLSVLMLDVDHFKQYNDEHGHLAGDEVLKQLAQVLGKAVAEGDELLARYGGEEFVLVLPGTSLENAIERAELIRQQCQLPTAVGGGITVSIGVACLVPHAGIGAEQLLAEADAALYRAKKHGRNRVERGRAG